MDEIVWFVRYPGPANKETPSFHHRHSTNWVSWSVTIIGEMQSHLTSFIDDGKASWYLVCRVPMVEWWLDCDNCCHLTVVGLHDTGSWTPTWLSLVSAFRSFTHVDSWLWWLQSQAEAHQTYQQLQHFVRQSLQNKALQIMGPDDSHKKELNQLMAR